MWCRHWLTLVFWRHFVSARTSVLLLLGGQGALAWCTLMHFDDDERYFDGALADWIFDWNLLLKFALEICSWNFLLNLGVFIEFGGFIDWITLSGGLDGNWLKFARWLKFALIFHRWWKLWNCEEGALLNLIEMLNFTRWLNWVFYWIFELVWGLMELIDVGVL